ncbi:MAG: hypothetical protein ACOYN4_08615 [Bacteroidales bacterium]
MLENMKIFLLTIALVINVVSTSAQLPAKKGYIAIPVGPAFPVGDFADKSISNPMAGAALNGYCNSLINFGYRFGKRIGVSAAFFYGEHFISDRGESDWWQVVGITVGPQYTFFLGKKFETDLKARLGLLITQKVIDTYANDDGLGNGFGLDLRASLRYNLFKRWCLLAETGYFAADQKYGDGHKGKLQAITAELGIGFRI